ncbi:MAG: RecB family exonuclease [Syntrophales bacterium]
MELSELRKTPHLSASSVGDYLDCSLLFKFGRIDKIKPAFTPDALEFGSAIHLVLAEINQQRMVGIHLSMKEIQESFENNWTKLAKDRVNLKFSEGKSFEILMLEGKELLSTYFHKRSDDGFNVIGVEESFSINLTGCPVPIIGAIDLIEEDSSGTIIITDYKTSGKAYSNADVDNNFQMTLYQIAVKQNGFADREILLKFDCLIKTKTPKFESYYTTRSEVDEKRAIRKIVEVQKGISKGVFIPNDSTSNWKCKGCSFKQPCNLWFMEDAA